jgi:ABC-type uncharacterized transport system substrate-binding protein
MFKDQNNIRAEQQRSNEQRSIARQLARELDPEELDVIAGGCTTCSCCRADDCGLMEQA